MNAPIVTTSRHGMAGLGTRKIAGISTTTKRIATNSVGGMSPRPSSMTTKLAPQMTVTSTARAT